MYPSRRRHRYDFRGTHCGLLEHGLWVSCRSVADEKNRHVQVATMTGQVIRVLAGDAANGWVQHSTFDLGLSPRPGAAEWRSSTMPGVSV